MLENVALRHQLDITERADLSKGTFFNDYQSKAHLLPHYGRELSLDFSAYGRKLKGDSTRELFRRFFARVDTVFRGEGALLDTLTRHVPEIPELQEAHRRGSAERMDMYRSIPESPRGAHRVVFEDIADDPFAWLSEYSTDGGKTWRAMMRMESAERSAAWPWSRIATAAPKRSA